MVKLVEALGDVALDKPGLPVHVRATSRKAGVTAAAGTVAV